jgi:alpha-L-fucosidase 2
VCSSDLPKALGSGSVKGLRARGGITVGMVFRSGKVESAELKLDAALTERAIKLRYNGKEISLTLKPGSVYKLEG